ncbi:hypothetical protein U1Q18_046019 [Sarracenia purpurea var. burkii]
MADNLLYDMDSTTGSSSSSDSDCPPRNQVSLVKSQDVASRKRDKSEQARGLDSLLKPKDRQLKSRPVSPVKEKTINRDLVSSSRPMQSTLAAGDIKNRRRAQIGTKDVLLHRRDGFSKYYKIDDARAKRL